MLFLSKLMSLELYFNIFKAGNILGHMLISPVLPNVCCFKTAGALRHHNPPPPPPRQNSGPSSSSSADMDDDQCSSRRILVPFQCVPSISFANENLMDPRIQVKLDKYQKCGNIISQTSLLSSKVMQIYTVDKYRGI